MGRILITENSPLQSRQLQIASQKAKELSRLHLFMGTYHWFARVLKKNIHQFSSGLLLGAADGYLGRFLYSDKLLREKIDITGIDSTPRPIKWPLPWKWVQTDILEFEVWERYSFIIANWFFFAFDESKLQRIGERIQHSKAFLLVFSEPYRSYFQRFELWVLHKIGLIRTAYPVVCRAVQAGFHDQELIQALHLESSQWQISTSSPLLLSQRVVAKRLL
ncbi:hypothetical protein A946_03075 [Methylacidiphilum kamchatkense Kam1]|uniref:Methyltransferase family protein n=1 Tax=Methylacidiphilum kamchatkense Kam1 TaxID=1202785 RepID=A0A0C1URV0_9BACT|nr:NAD(P)-dependent oxidoreductase [Methylacidiphilum kamchatkense]KIE59034.1 hypothetical protein A946_03075 [Methylacidiphilum kamchatkense Kam1]QDQ43066.1 hypothetical protein kam1_1854 [Methylacidiphilum kamchatkense Kam1]